MRVCPCAYSSKGRKDYDDTRGVGISSPQNPCPKRIPILFESPIEFGHSNQIRCPNSAWIFLLSSEERQRKLEPVWLEDLAPHLGRALTSSPQARPPPPSSAPPPPPSSASPPPPLPSPPSSSFSSLWLEKRAVGFEATWDLQSTYGWIC